MAQSMRDEPGTQREFETIFILRPDTNQDGIQLVNTRVSGVIEQLGGRVLKLDNWGKRKLAYEVKKQLKGIYLYWQYLGTTGVVEEIERNLRMLDQVIRYYTVKVDENVDPTAKPGGDRRRDVQQGRHDGARRGRAGHGRGAAAALRGRRHPGSR